MANSKDIAAQLEEVLSQYTEDVTREIEGELLNVTNATVKMLKSNSPEKTGKYAAGWGRNKSKDGYIVSNKAKPGLTHLLEFGHAKPGGRTKPKVHIAPAEDFAIEEVERKIIAAIERSGN